MLRGIRVFLLVIVSIIFYLGNVSFAQEVAPVQKDAKLMEKKAKKADCVCAKPAVDLIKKAYASVEEDEWKKAIAVCKGTITSINNLSKTCKCPEMAVYKKIAEAFLKYSLGGDHLDGADEPDCNLAKGLYGDSIKFLEEALPNTENEKIREYARAVLDYAKEEQAFVKDECQVQPQKS